MADYIVDAGAQVACGHGPGTAWPALENPLARVWLSRQAAVLMNERYEVLRCPVNSPCVTASWVLGAPRVKSMGQPLLLASSQSVANTGMPLRVLRTQMRVKSSPVPRGRP